MLVFKDPSFALELFALLVLLALNSAYLSSFLLPDFYIYLLSLPLNT